MGIEEFLEAVRLNFKAQGWWNLIWIAKLLTAALMAFGLRISMMGLSVFAKMGHEPVQAAVTGWRSEPYAGFTFMWVMALLFVFATVYLIAGSATNAFQPWCDERERRKIRKEIDSYMKEKGKG